MMSERTEKEFESEKSVNSEESESSQYIEIEKYKNQIEHVEKQLEQWKDKTLRLSADVENMRRRSSEEQRMQKEKIEKKFFLDLLPIIDNFDRAIATRKQTDDESGLLLIRNLFQKFLTDQGVSEIKQLEQFDPELHEAIAQIADDTKQSGAIVEVFEKGYRLHDRVLRAAKVAVVA